MDKTSNFGAIQNSPPELIRYFAMENNAFSLLSQQKNVGRIVQIDLSCSERHARTPKTSSGGASNEVGVRKESMTAAKDCERLSI